MDGSNSFELIYSGSNIPASFKRNGVNFVLYHDPVGNITTSYLHGTFNSLTNTYDPFTMMTQTMTSGGNQTAFQYDSRKERILKTVNGSQKTLFAGGGDDKYRYYARLPEITVTADRIGDLEKISWLSFGVRLISDIVYMNFSDRNDPKYFIEGGEVFAKIPPKQEIITGVVPGSISGPAPVKTVNLITKTRTIDNGLEIAERFLGKGYKEIAPGVFRSSDGLRQFRMTDADILGLHGKIGPHFNFEIYNPSNLRIPIKNYHMRIR